MLNLEIIGQGAMAAIYRDGDKAVKLYTNALQSTVENEAKRQQFAASTGLPVPAVIGVRVLDDNYIALDMEYINGTPFMKPTMDNNEQANCIRTLVKLQCDVHKIDANTQPKQVDKFMQRIKHTPHLSAPEKNKLLALLSQLDTKLSNLCHGDFHPLNILYDGDKYWIIDWVDAAAGNPLADVCRTYLIFKQFVSELAEVYLRTFCDEANVKAEDVMVWLPIVSAVRLDENIDGEARVWLKGIVQQA